MAFGSKEDAVMRYRRMFRLTIVFFMLSILEAPAWAGGGGLLWFAATLGLYAAATGPYGWYAPYYADPYYPSYRYPPPYAYANVPYSSGSPTSAYETPRASSPNRQPVRQENLRPSLPNMTPPVGEPLPANAVPRYDVKKVTEKLATVRALLNKKAAAGEVTHAQRDSEATYLTQIERVARAQASAQKGLLSSNQEEALLHEIMHANTLITQNFVTFSE